MKQTKRLVTDPAQMRANVARVWELRDAHDQVEGTMAYIDYHRTLSELGAFYGVSVTVAAGVFSALSPNNDYHSNLRSAATVLHAVKHGIAEADTIVTTYNTNRTKAFRLARGEHFYAVFKGLKTRNFFRNLTEPNHPEAVTVDGHIHNIVNGEARILTQSGLGNNRYEAIRRLLIDMAGPYKVLPSQLQAILWFTWKRINGIKHDPQLSLFETGNTQQTYLPPDRIRLYAPKIAS